MQQSALGIAMAGVLVGMRDMANKTPWSYQSGIPTALGSAAVILSFYQSHKVIENGQRNWSNIVKVSLVAIVFIGFNIAYWAGSPSPINMCKTDPTLWYCQTGSPMGFKFGKATGP